MFVNYNKYKDIENWLKDLLLYSFFSNIKKLKLGINATWHDACCQLDVGISKIKSILN
jgi:hypothetical protein